jgi:DNA-binding CsgD family transcriptional regulator
VTLSRRRAALVAAACEGVRTPALAALDAPDLAACEREIARLAAGGLSNRGIAKRLGIAVRTVDNHPHRALPSSASAAAVSWRRCCSTRRTTPDTGAERITRASRSSHSCLR